MSNIAPETPSWAAFKIVSGPLDLSEKFVQLKQLAAQYPDDEGVTGYFESLEMQRLLEESRGGQP